MGQARLRREAAEREAAARAIARENTKAAIFGCLTLVLLAAGIITGLIGIAHWIGRMWQ